MTLLTFTNHILGIGTALAQIFVGLSVVYFLLLRKKFPSIGEFLGKYALHVAFLVSLGSTFSSLFYSQIAQFAPCELCWLQRVFMYPLVIIFLMALVKKDRNIIDYVLVISGIGFLVSLYHNYIYYYNQELNANCQLLSSGVSCIKRYVFELGYITIPIMAITSFMVIITLLIFYKFSNDESTS